MISPPSTTGCRPCVERDARPSTAAAENLLGAFWVSGPYHLVRHPIYSGILVAGVGTALALGWTWLIAVVLAGVYFIHRAPVEERYLNQRFPDTYPGYRRSTTMLVPFVF